MNPTLFLRAVQSLRCDGCHGLAESLASLLTRTAGVAGSVPHARSPATEASLAAMTLILAEVATASAYLAAGRHICEDKFGKRDLDVVK